MFQNDHRYNTCRRPISSSFIPNNKAEYCTAAGCRPLSSSRRTFFATKVSSYYSSKGTHFRPLSMQGDQLRDSFCMDGSELPAGMLSKRTRFLDQTKRASVFFIYGSRFTMERNLGRLLNCRQQRIKWKHPTLLWHKGTEMVESWLEQPTHPMVTWPASVPWKNSEWC